MAAITPSTKVTEAIGGGAAYRQNGASAANSGDTMTTTAIPDGRVERLVDVEIAYTSGSTYTATGLTISRDSALGATYDCVLFTGSSNNATSVHYPPTNETVLLWPGDALAIVVPAGGSGKIASITVFTEKA